MNLKNIIISAASLSLAAAVSADTIPATAYVQNSLVVQYDGLENAGVGVHGDTITAWKDLTGNGHDLALATGDTVGADCVHIARGTRTATNDLFSAYTSITIEFNARPTTMDAAGNWDAPIVNIPYIGAFGWDGRTGAIHVKRPYSSTATKYTYLSYNSGYSMLSDILAAGVFQTYSARPGLGAKGAAIDPVYVNGVKVAKTGGLSWEGGTRTANYALAIGNAKTASDVRSIRIYSRELSATEVAINAAVDKIRFEGADLSVIPAGYHYSPTRGLVVANDPTETLEVVGTPAEYGEPTPAYGETWEVFAGNAISVSNSVAYAIAQGTMVACTDWRLYDAEDAVVASGTGRSFTYVHPTPAAYRKLEWRWETSNLVTVASEDLAKGSVSFANGWYRNDDAPVATATPASGYVFVYWSGDVVGLDANLATLSVSADRPRNLIAHFARADVTDGFDHVVYLSEAGSDSNGGTSWADAFLTPSAAVAAAGELEGSVLVLAAQGTYQVTNTLVVSGTTTLRGATGDPEDVVFHLKTGIARLLTLNSATAAVEGVTLEGGSEKGSSASAGAGRNLYVSAGTVTNCIVRGAVLTNPGNSKHAASTVYLTGANALMTHCVVSNNVISGSGASTSSGIVIPGVYVTGGAALKWTLVANNRDTGRRTRMSEAGGVHVDNGTMTRCTIVDNVGPYVGGVNLASSGRAVDCIVACNRSIWNSYTTDDILSSTSSRFTGCVIAPESPNMLFRDYSAHDYRLMPGDNRQIGCYPTETGRAVGFAAQAHAIALPTETTLTASVAGLSASGLQYAWDFDGDGTADETTATPSVTHTFTACGDVEVGLVVTDTATSTSLSSSRTIHFVPKTLRVAPNAPAPGFPYDSWENAAPDVKTALDASIDGCMIVVSNGTYEVASTISIELKAPHIKGLTGNPNDVILHSATGGRILYLNDCHLIIDGITLLGGSGTGNGRNFYMEHLGGTITNCVIRGCALSGSISANSYATTAYVRSPYALITHCAITNNTCSVSSGSASSYDCTPGISLNYGAQLVNTLVADNIDTAYRTVKNYAAGVYASNARLLNCTIVNNSGNDVGGLRLNDGSATNCVIAGNSTTALAVEYGNIYPGSESRFKYCATDHDAPINATSTNAPVSVLFAAFDAHDYRPVANSPLVDSGVSAGLGVGSADLDGNDRIMGDAIDIGCYELDVEAFAASFSTEATSLILPRTVTFTAACSGAGENDVIRYSWDFNGDGETDLVTTDATVTWTYTQAGNASVSMSAVNETTGARSECVREDYLYLVPQTMLVAPTSEASAFPYDTWRNAATNVQDAVNAAIDGVTIVVSNGTYALSRQIAIEKGVTLRGLTGNPEDVVFINNNATRLLYLNHADVVAAGFVFQGGSGTGTGRSIYIDTVGGTLSNCVVRGCAMSGSLSSGGTACTVYSRSAYALITHCAVTNNTCAVSSGSGSSGVCATGIAMGSGGRIENTLVADNTDTASRSVKDYASGVYASSARLLNCTIVNNSGNDVGGLRLNAGSATNCVIAGNASTALAVTYANIYPGSESRFNHCATDDADPINATSTNAPVSVLFAAWDGHDYRPVANSPLVDAGVSAGLGVGTADLDGQNRIMGDAIDIGCYELDVAAFAASFSTEATSLILPCTVTFTAACSGAGENDVIRYTWDFDGDGTADLVTTDATATWTYTTAGTVSVSMSAVDETTGDTGECVREDYLYLVPPTMYVAKTSPAPAFPYDSWENAATNAQDAIDAAIDGVTVLVTNGFYAVTKRIWIEKGVKFRSLTGNPEDVILANSNSTRVLYLNHADALAAGFVVEGGTGTGLGRSIYIDTVGGTVSNCVIRGTQLSGSVNSGGKATPIYAVGARSWVTHCVITGNVFNVYSGSGSSGVMAPAAHVASSAKLSNTLIADNTDTNRRTVTDFGMVYASGSAKVVNCTVVRNTSYEVGGIRLNGATAVNCVVAGNESTGLGNSYDNIALGTASSFTTSVIGGDLDALFRSPARGNWRPNVVGPLIDAGTITAGLVPAIDLLGSPRVFGRSIDIGCIESMHNAGTIILLQ